MDLPPLQGLDRPRAQWALAVTCVLLMAVGIWSVVRLRSAQRELLRLATASEQREAQLTQQLAQTRTQREAAQADLDQARRLLAAQPSASHALLALAPVTRRTGRGPETTFTLPKDADVVDLQLGLPSTSRSPAYRARLRTWSGGEEVWTQGRLKAGKSTLVIYLPSSVLTPGPYELGLTAIGPNGSEQDVAFYEFTIIR